MPRLKCTPTGRRLALHSHCKINPTNNTEKAMCHVCLGNSKDMVYISKSQPGSSISHCTHCSEFFTNEFEVKKENPLAYPVKSDLSPENGFLSQELSPVGQFECQVKNEFIEEDELEENVGQDSDLYIDFESHCEVKIEENCDYMAYPDETSKDESSTFNCSHCPETYAEAQSLLKHMESHMKCPRSNINFKFQVGSRQGSRLIHTLDDNQLYCKNKVLKNGDTTYVCRVKDCKARVYLAKDATHVYAREDHVLHNHSSQDLEIKKIIAMDEVKNKCKNDSSNLKKIFNDVMAEYTQEGAEIKISYDSFKRTLQRKRQPGRLSRLKARTPS